MTVCQLLIRLNGGNAPAVQPLGCLGSQVDTAMTARTAKVVVPVGAVEGCSVFFNIGHPRYTRQIESAGGQVTSGHVPRGPLMECEEVSGWRCISSTAEAPSGGG